LEQEDYRKLISGQSRGIGAMLLRFLLYIASIFYQLVVCLRNFLYSSGWLKIHHANAIVISVGNITVGGTGKTPLVIWMCKFLQQKNIPVAILTRGYKTQAKGRGTKDEGRETRIDEPGILTESCPQAKIIVNPDRVAGANEAVNKFGIKVLIMDDGFQHRRLGRDLDIVTIDGTRPFGYDKLLPAGLLREPVDSLKRADAIIITRSNQVSESELNKIEEKIQKIKSNIVITRSIHSPVCARTTDNKEISIEQLKGKKIFAFCGIGNPDAFIETIKGLGVNLVGVKIYDDHYHYADKDMDDIRTKAKELKAELVLTTQKDWSKLSIENRKSKAKLVAAKIDIPFAYLVVEIKFPDGENKLKQLIEGTLSGKIAILQK